MSIVGLKIVKALIRINRTLHTIQKMELITRDFCCSFYHVVDLLTLKTLTRLYFSKPIDISDQYCFEKLPNNYRFGAYRDSHLVVLES